MVKESSYQEIFTALEPWLVQIIETVKKDLKIEHLKIDRDFCKKYFLAKNPNAIKSEEMAPAYLKDIQAGNVGLGEFIASRWIIKHTEIYNFFEEQLKAINPDFDQIETLSVGESESIKKTAVQQFGPINTYIFSILNQVAFPEEVYSDLKKAALGFKEEQKSLEDESYEKDTVETLKKRNAREISALTDRFEKKILGLQKKYIQDVEALKKQNAILQKKLQERTLQETV